MLGRKHLLQVKFKEFKWDLIVIFNTELPYGISI